MTSKPSSVPTATKKVDEFPPPNHPLRNLVPDRFRVPRGAVLPLYDGLRGAVAVAVDFALLGQPIGYTFTVVTAASFKLVVQEHKACLH